jgi:hypothetical protein
LSIEQPQLNQLEERWRERQHQLQNLLKEKVKGKGVS